MLDPTHLEIGNIYKAEYARVLAGLIRILGDLELAEDALQEAFTVAVEKWSGEGIPQNPYAWLISTAKFKAIDSMRRQGRGKELIEENSLHAYEQGQSATIDSMPWAKHIVEDDQLRLIFLCCHPMLPLDARIALSLREVCGMSTGDIARAYLVPVDTIKKRLSRAKALIKEKNIPFDIPSRAELKLRTEAVLRVIYLVFNEGYSASSGKDHIRKELTQEAIFLSRKLVALIGTPESMGLLALLLLNESRRDARVSPSGDVIPLEEQDRTQWDQALIREGVQLIEAAVMSGRLGAYTLQAAIASVHALAESVEKTRWDVIVGYYDMLLSIHPSPVVELHRAIAVGMRDGPKAGLDIIAGLVNHEKLKNYHLVYAAQADFYKRSGLNDQAVRAYKRALELVRQEPEKRYLAKQLAILAGC